MFKRCKKVLVALRSVAATPAGMPLGFSAVVERVGFTDCNTKWQITLKRFGRVVHSGLLNADPSHDEAYILKAQLRWLGFGATDVVEGWAEHVARCVPLAELGDADLIADVKEEWEHESKRAMKWRAECADALKDLGFNSVGINKLFEVA
jgi:hypothetical protein